MCVPWQKFTLNYFHQKIDKFLTHENLVHVLYQVKKSPGLPTVVQDCHSGLGLPQWSRTAHSGLGLPQWSRTAHSGLGLPQWTRTATVEQDCHSGAGLPQTFPVHIAEISLDITKSPSLGVWQSDLSYRTMSQCLLLTTECESESTKTHIHLWSKFTTWDLEFLQAWYGYCMILNSVSVFQ